MPGTHFSHHNTHAKFNEDTHHTWKEVTERKGLIIKLPVSLFSPSSAIIQMPSSDTNPYQLTKYHLPEA